MKKIVVSVISLFMLVSVSILLLDIFETISTDQGRNEFKNTIMDMGVLGCFALIGLNIAQIFLFFFPGEPIELLAGMCYGAIGGLAVIYIGVFISSCIIFFLIRKIGRSAINELIGEKMLKRIINSKVYKSKNAEKILLFLCVLPGTPKDLLIYIGALLPIKPSRFILLSTLLRFPSIITSTIAGESFSEGNNQFAVLVYAITIIVSLIVLKICSQKDNIREIMDINRKG